MTVLIGVISQDTARFSGFCQALSAMDTPPGTLMEWVIGHDIPANQNQLVDSLLDSDASHLLIMGDDHVFAPDLLNRLLDHDVDLVAPVCVRRFPPYLPTAFQDDRPILLSDYPDGGLAEVDMVGSAGLLAKREVFEEMDRPWFEYGRLQPTQIAEDLYFCRKARELGYEVWYDLDTPLGHCVTGAVWPVKTSDGWTYGFTMTGGMKMTVPV